MEDVSRYLGRLAGWLAGAINKRERPSDRQTHSPAGIVSWLCPRACLHVGQVLEPTTGCPLAGSSAGNCNGLQTDTPADASLSPSGCASCPARSRRLRPSDNIGKVRVSSPHTPPTHRAHLNPSHTRSTRSIEHFKYPSKEQNIEQALGHTEVVYNRSVCT